MESYRLAAEILAIFAVSMAGVFAADPTPTPTPVPTPVPNTVSLHAFVGKYKGRSKVILGLNPSYAGGAKFQITAASDTTLLLKIIARVATPNGFAAINNQLSFTRSGIMKGRELAPGIARHAPFKGFYTARPHRITFQGSYDFTGTTGTFTGTITRNPKGRVFVKYSIFVEDATDAVYTYSYSAIQKKKVHPHGS